MDLHHTCLGCGGSCRGVNARAVDDAERARITTLAAELGVEEPWVDGRLRRTEDDACVFLDADERCRLHAAYGAEAKPRICAQYPVVAVHTGTEVRAGIDPGCFTHLATWKTGPALRPGAVRAARVVLSQPAEADETRVLACCGADTLAALLRGLAEAPGAGLPEGFLTMTAARVRVAELGRVTARPGYGAAVRTALAPLAAADLDLPWRPPAPELEAYAVDCVRRAVALRLLDHLGSPTVAAFLMAVGGVAAAMARLEDRAFGAAIAAWSRGLRTRPFVEALLPDRNALGSWVAELR
jgi:hypothetical protein